ncbi:MAG: magnesium transporter [Ignavibacteria bacterium]|nr:magnesium transporter [Ignavibacteria bacterium]
MTNIEKRKKAIIDVDNQLLSDISDLIKSESSSLLKNILADIYSPDIALIIDNLNDEEGLWLFKLLDSSTSADVLLDLSEYPKKFILDSLNVQEVASLIKQMDSDDAADIIGTLEEDKADEVLRLLDSQDLSEVKELLTYDENSAGGIMQKEFVTVSETDSINKAVEIIKEKAADNEHFYHVWVTDQDGRLTGIVSLKKIIVALDTPAMIMADIMTSEVISVNVNTDQEEVAKIMQKYDLVSIPVVDDDNKVVGKITFDDIADIMEEEFSEDVAKIVGSDAEELASKSAFQVAMMRLPWVLITLGIQFLAGVVIHYYDETLSKVILLASFMPIISAISGNTGLQASAMTVRALATGNVTLSNWAEPIKRSIQISLIIGSVCGLILGIVGGIWYGKVAFGLVVGISMCISINISALVGTSTPLISKKAGFDPAITVGPFETAFQDVVGITVFLTLATLSLKWLVH